MKIRTYKGAGMILFHKDGDRLSVLLEKRSDNHTWAIPGGGYSPAKDKSLLDTAIRETFEETGIHVREASLIRTYRLPLFTYAVYASELDSKVIPKKNWESDEIQWFHIKKLPKGINWMTMIELNDFIRRKDGIWGQKS